MKKILFTLVALLMMCVTVNAQSQTNYAGSSKFTDNISMTLQGGVLTTMNDFFSSSPAMAPVVVLGGDKFLNPWLGIGVDARALIGTGTVGESRFNSHTALDALNLSAYVKFNVLNLINGFNGTRQNFEPVVYTGLGWGHQFCGCVTNDNIGSHVIANRDYLTYRAGCEFHFNLGEKKAWGIVVNPSVVWGDICNGKLEKGHANFEVTCGMVYHFKTSNGTHTFAKAQLRDQAEIDALNAKINELQNRPEKVIIEKVIQVPTTNTAMAQGTAEAVLFAKNSSQLTDAAKATLDKIPSGSKVNIIGTASPEGKFKRNAELTVLRAKAVADYLKARGVNVVSVKGGVAGRTALITLE